jgi:hypothetical protein
MNTFNDYPPQDLGGDFQQREGKVARSIEKQTAKLPSDLFLWAAGAAVVGSLALQVFGMKRKSNTIGGLFKPFMGRPAAPLASFVGQWAPTLLLFGVYNKIVKVAGSDRFSQ